MESQGRSRKVMDGLVLSLVAHRILMSAPVPVPFLWTLDFAFGTWVRDMDLGLGFGTKDLDLGLTIVCCIL